MRDNPLGFEDCRFATHLPNLVELTIEPLESLKFWHMRHGEVPRGVDDVVKFLRR